MMIRITNTVLLKQLIVSLGKRGEAQLELGADISRTTIKEMTRGACPSPRIREKVAAFFEKEEDEIFPVVQRLGEAA